MLRVGLTGGIASGKSSVARRLQQLGARLIDSDVLAREVVAPGTPGLALVVERFGTKVLAPDGGLDRPSLGRTVFGDPVARADLEAIIHPLVLARTQELMARSGDGAIVVHDIPLLVELDRGGDYHLVAVVGAAAAVRRQRLISDRSMSPEDADRRIAAQADDEARRRSADVWLPNEGSHQELVEAVDRLWRERLVPYEQNLREGRSSASGGPVDRAARARVVRRIEQQRDHADVAATVRVDDDGSVVLHTDAGTDAVRSVLAGAGFVPLTDHRYASADPGLGLVVTVEG